VLVLGIQRCILLFGNVLGLLTFQRSEFVDITLSLFY